MINGPDGERKQQIPPEVSSRARGPMEPRLLRRIRRRAQPRIAIQPDLVVHPNGERQSFSDRWIALAAGHHVEPVIVDVFPGDSMAQIANCDAFMWRYPSSNYPRAYAQRLLYAVEQGLRIPVFPSCRSSWFYEDKLAQNHFFEAADIPHAKTRIFRARSAADGYCDTACYPFVLKLAGGHQSANVRLVRTRNEARFYIGEMFGHGVVSLAYRPATRLRQMLRQLHAAAQLVKGHNPYASTGQSELQYGYFYAQEFLSDNDFEISAIVIGKRAFACRRFIAEKDFRTRGSTGRMDFDPAPIGQDAIRLAFRVAHKLGAQTIGVDILRRGSEPVVIELTVNYASWVVQACPGHWRLDGDAESGRLVWVDGCVRAADAILEDFLREAFRSKHASGNRIAATTQSPR